MVGNVENVTAVINSSIIFTTLEDCRREIQEHNFSVAAHDNLARKEDVYTKTETDNKLKDKADKQHGLHVPTTQTPSNSVFLRNDNTWQTITPNNIGAYHKTEIDDRVNAKVSKSGDTMTGALNVHTINFEAGYIGTRTRDTGDAITGNGGANVNIGSWYGVGFYSTQQQRYTGTMDLRTGNWRTVGKMKADLGFEGTATNANKLQDWTLQNILDEFLNVWHSNKTYTVGDIAYHKNLPTWARLECVVAGTSNAAITFSNEIKAGQYVSDGSVKWIVDDVRDGTTVGDVRGCLYIPDGYVKADGATVQRADYPRLVTLANKYNLWTDNTAANLGMFGRGNGSSTFMLPNWIDRMTQFASTSGSTIAAGLPNIAGKVYDISDFGDESYYKNEGAMTIIKGTSSGIANINGGSRSVPTGINFDASRSNPIYGASNTVQPAAIKMIPIIKY